MIEWLGLAVAAVAAYLAWRANSKSDDANTLASDANTIAAQALAISEREEADRQHERAERARLSISTAIVGYEPGEDGVYRFDGSGGQLKLAISVDNSNGDRAAGRTDVEAIFPPTFGNRTTYWSDSDGRQLSPGENAMRSGESTVLSRTVDAIPSAIPLRLFVAFLMNVPNSDAVDTLPIRIRVVADGAEPREVVHDFPLRIGRALNL